MESCWLNDKYIFFGHFVDLYLLSVGRYLKRIRPLLKTMEFGWDTRVELAITICTRNTVIPHLMVQLSKCTLKWLLVIESDFLAFRSSKQQLFQPSFARGRVPNSFITRRLNSHWFSGKYDHLQGSWRQLTKLPGLTCSCNSLSYV